MAKKTSLFYLIKSLNKSEKRYFKRFCLIQKVGANYIRLFEVYDKQQALDEAAVKKVFEGENFAKQIAVTKNYLRQLILKSLRNYHTDCSTVTTINNLLHHVAFLFEKGLYDFCQVELKKAEQLARRFEVLDSLKTIISWKRKLLLAQKGGQPASLLQLIREEEDTIQKIKRVNAYWEKTCRIIEFQQNTLDEFLGTEPLASFDERKASLGEVIMHHHLLYTYLTISNKETHGVAILNQLIQKLEAFPERISEDPQSYITTLNNIVGALLRLGEHQEALTQLEKLKKVPDEYQLKKASQFPLKTQLRIYNIELEIYRDTRQWEEAASLIEEIESYLDRNQRALPDSYELLFAFQFSYIFFMRKEYASALKWINELLAISKNTQRTDIQTYGRLLNLMIHFEMGNIMVLKYAIANGKRFLKKQKTIQPFEAVLLRFFSKICNAPASEYAMLFERLHQDLFGVEPPLVNDNVLDYLDFKTWINAWRAKA